MRLGGVLIFVAILASWLALSPHGGTRGTEEGERASATGDSSYRDRVSGVETSIPRGWHTISQPITSITHPRQVLVATSFPASPPRSLGGCKQNAILKQMPRSGAYVFVLEYLAQSQVPGPAPTPKRLSYSDGRYGSFECGGRGYVFDFSIDGRTFQANVVMNPRIVDPAVKAQALWILNTFDVPAGASTTTQRRTRRDTTYRNRAAGVEASIPSGWHPISSPITGSAYPKQVFAATSFPAAPPRSPRGGCTPTEMQRQMPRSGAFVFVKEYTADYRVPKLPPKPARLRYSDGRYGHFECGGPGYLFDFSIGGRAFQASAVLNQGIVDPTVRAQALEILNSFHALKGGSEVAHVSFTERWTLLDHSEVGSMEWTCSGGAGRMRFTLGSAARVTVRVGPFAQYTKGWLQPGSAIEQPLGALPQRWRIESESEVLPPIGRTARRKSDALGFVFRVLPGQKPCTRPAVTHHHQVGPR